MSVLRTLNAKRARKQAQARELINIEDLEQYQNLIIFAETTVEGYLAGRHPSPDFGSSGEFVEYKPYLLGDDVRNIDWKVYQKNRKLLVKQYLEETDMVSYIVVDCSRSMEYQCASEFTKYQVASKIAAALTYLILRQGDKVSLTLFNEDIQAHIKPGATRSHFFKVAEQLSSTIPQSKTKIADSLHACADLFRKRGQVILISDCLTQPEETLNALSLYRHRGFEVLVLRILDPGEVDLPNVAMARFIDMETKEEISVDPSEVRRNYAEDMKQNIEKFADGACDRSCAYNLVDSKRPYLDAIETYLNFRTNKRS